MVLSNVHFTRMFILLVECGLVHRSDCINCETCYFVRSFCFCLMSSDAKSILGTIYKVSLFWIYGVLNEWVSFYSAFCFDINRRGVVTALIGCCMAGVT